MQILVTGGAGFIGSHLADRLAELGHQINVLDNFSSGKRDWLNKKATLFKGDVESIFDVKKAISGCDAVFHLAALTDVRNSDDDRIFRVNYMGSKNVFDAAAKQGAKTIFASSAAVYGNADMPNSEDTKLAPISAYGKTKLKAEKLLKDAFIARIFNAYGSRGKSVINRFCSNVKSGKKATVFGSGMQSRDYVYVSDVVNALLLGLEHTGTYNVAAGTETTLLNILDIIGDISGSEPNTEFSLPIEGEIKRSKADISKIKALGWQPAVSIEDGIRYVWRSL